MSSQSHDINVNGVRRRPDYVAADAAGFTVTVTDSQVSVTNNNTTAASVNVWLELIHTIPRELGGLPNLVPQPFIASSGTAGGGSFDDLAIRRTLNILLEWPFIVLAEPAGTTTVPYYNVIAFAQGSAFNDINLASITECHGTTNGVIASLAANRSAPIAFIYSPAFPFGDGEVTGFDPTVWTPGNSQAWVQIFNGNVGANVNLSGGLLSPWPNIILRHEDARSLPANRLNLPGGTDITLPYGFGIKLQYSTSISRWVPTIPV
ncbi:MAG: hypothetical protein Q6370_010730 [Candidatus Sigynarchaeota archaeon]|jgi:hypothetical protein